MPIHWSIMIYPLLYNRYINLCVWVWIYVIYIYTRNICNICIYIYHIYIYMYISIYIYICMYIYVYSTEDTSKWNIITHTCIHCCFTVVKFTTNIGKRWIPHLVGYGTERSVMIRWSGLGTQLLLSTHKVKHQDSEVVWIVRNHLLSLWYLESLFCQMNCSYRGAVLPHDLFGIWIVWNNWEPAGGKGLSQNNQIKRT